MYTKSPRALTSQRDRVSQVYFGIIQRGESDNILRRRIDWITEQVQGQRILDVGCSEGVLEILLARRCFDVTGVDINAEALAFARNLLENEPKDVIARVRFIQGDMTQTMLAGESFDTVIIGEVLEHLDDPEELLDRSLDLLTSDGRIVITTPFGYHPHDDHRQVFCLANFLALVSPRYFVEHLQIEDGYIRMTGGVSHNRSNASNFLDWRRIVSLTEASLIASQRILYDRISKHGARIKQLELQLNGREGTVDLVPRLAERDKQNTSRLQRILQKKSAEAVQLQQHIQGKRNEAAWLKEQVNRELRTSAVLRCRLEQKENTIVGLEQRLQSRELGSRREIAALNQRLDAVLSSTTFRAGATLVATAKEPRTLWRLPIRLWRLYREVRPPARVSKPRSIDDRSAHSVAFPKLALPEPRSAGAPVIAAILDTFSEYCLRYEANLVLLTPKQWKRQLERSRPAFLIVESAWWGNGGAWRGMITGFAQRDVNPLRDLLDYCRCHGVTTVFWNKEDPPNFDFFISAAKQFDFVFTTDSDRIPRYREVCGHESIFAMSFAAQPQIHNPSRGSSWPMYPVCFAGSWMGEKHKVRAKSLEYLLDPALSFGLHIFDRNLNRATHRGSNYEFPDRYHPAIKGSLSYQEMLAAYRCYKVMLNTNSVTASPTMFSRRVFESLACGTPVISTPSSGMEEMLGDHVAVTQNENQTESYLTALLTDEERRQKRAHLGYRFIHTHHTYRHRMDDIFMRIGLDANRSSAPTVSVVVRIQEPKDVTRVKAMFANQQYPYKELLLVLTNRSLDFSAVSAPISDLERCRWLRCGSSLNAAVWLREAILAETTDYIATMVPTDHYGEHYISDMMLAANYSNADVLGKGTFFVYEERSRKLGVSALGGEHQYTDLVAGSTLVARRELLATLPPPALEAVLNADWTALRDATGAGCMTYSADRFNYIAVRGSRAHERASKLDAARIVKECQDVRRGLDLGRVMI